MPSKKIKAWAPHVSGSPRILKSQEGQLYIFATKKQAKEGLDIWGSLVEVQPVTITFND